MSKVIKISTLVSCLLSVVWALLQCRVFTTELLPKEFGFYLHLFHLELKYSLIKTIYINVL